MAWAVKDPKQRAELGLLIQTELRLYFEDPRIDVYVFMLNELHETIVYGWRWTEEGCETKVEQRVMAYGIDRKISIHDFEWLSMTFRESYQDMLDMAEDVK